MNISIRKVLLSPDHAIFAYNTEREGMEYGELHLKDLNHRDQWTVYAHRIGTSQEDDILVYEEMDDTAFVDITSTKDMKYVTINSNTLSSSEVRVIDASHDYTTATLPKIQLIEPRREGVEYYVDHHQSNFYILTNVHGATNFKLVRTHDTNMAMSHWEDVIQMKPTEKIEDVDLFQNNIVIYGRRDGLPMILCYDVHTQETHSVPLTEKFCVLCPGTNQDFNTDTFRFSFTSPFHHDNPVLMRSYGAYGVATDPDFRIEHFPLLERGWVIALAHVSFRDFSSVAEHLIQNKLTAPQYMAGLGTSAGGLLVGAMTHMKPELFKALVLRVPFVDPLSAMLNPELPLTQVEYPEWGNPSADKKAYELIEKYSPYENINSNSTMSSLPSLLVTGGMKDQRVQYWQPLKFVARLRQVFGEKSNKVLLKMDLDRGHFGGGTEQDVRLQEAAEQVAFLISEVQEMRKEKGQ
ncbi:prolyl oligopeptidase family-domain-containing protein [Radiomyces spectabilis]|uniref:prolyl oligopeptidase family-domain-containing protein n=1 Tax=Radiomyces spectabilis TaxID=64574 RepID=UPI0022205318|nr:prolyl oligopeptidase family-domain-containing protein [Radiomyces spectabilis]KAI8381259.1 prolyl oligopeptidase family-domain-containing protein [Radiomyces spectabilis]